MTDQSKNARELLVRILKSPEELDMDHWYRKNSCGTAACLAGHSALLMGWKPCGDHTITFRDPANPHEYADVSDLGQTFLGLDDETANLLFLGTRNTQALKVLDRAAQGEPITVAMVREVLEEETDYSYRRQIVKTLQAKYLEPEELAEIQARAKTIREDV